jgi:hypothetical protein
MKTINLTMLTAAMLSIFGLMMACQITSSSKKESPAQVEIKTSDNKPAPKPVKTETPESSTGALSTPTETYKTAFAARQKKDVKALKLALSKQMLEFFTEMGKMEKKTADDMLKEMVEQPQAKNPEVRNVKISGNEASLEYLDEKGAWKPMDFIKDGNDWKITIPIKQGR